MRFAAPLEAELLADDNVPNGNWNPDNRQLKLDRNNADNPNSNSGFRLSMRGYR